MKKIAKFIKKDNKGFTLVEIIVVLAILAILIAVALPSMTGILQDSKGKVLMQDARASLIAYQLKRTDTPAPTVIKEAEILVLIDKTAETDKTNIQMAVTEDAKGKITGFAYADEGKVKSKAIGIKSEGKETDVATVYNTFAEAVTATGGTILS